MKVKQINLRCFEIALEKGEAAEFEAYVAAHEAILRRYLLLLQGGFDERIDRFLRSEGYTYAWADAAPLVAKPATKSVSSAPEPKRPQAPERTLIVRRPVRSGEQIEHGADAIIFGRINSGAQVSVSGNCLLFGPLFGLCSCDGEVAQVNEVGKGGLFIFHETVFESADLAGGKRLFFEGGEVKIEDLS
ncbi:MAG: septum site-determining protein MinC [Campylobacterales bacterium]